MSNIILSEAAIDENGQTGYEGTTPGDQTNNEVRRIAYYNYKKNWQHIYRWKDSKIAQRFAIRMMGAADNAKIGYSQPKRYTYWEQLKASSYDPLKITTACEVDCSALVCGNVNAALLEANIKTSISPFEYTASMEKAFSADSNFTDVISSVDITTGEGLQVGDILLGPAQTHTAAVISVEKGVSTTPKYTVEATAYVPVYADETKKKLALIPALGVGNKVDYCDETDGFYYVKIGQVYGFVEKRLKKV